MPNWCSHAGDYDTSSSARRRAASYHRDTSNNIAIKLQGRNITSSECRDSRVVEVNTKSWLDKENNLVRNEVGKSFEAQDHYILHGSSPYGSWLLTEVSLQGEESPRYALLPIREPRGHGGIHTILVWRSSLDDYVIQKVCRK